MSRRTGDYDIDTTAVAKRLKPDARLSQQEILTGLRLRLTTLRELHECKVSRFWCGDKVVVLAALKLDGLELKYADYAAPDSPPLNDADDVVQVAVAQNGLALEFASKRLRREGAVIATASAQNPRSLLLVDSAVLKSLDLDSDVCMAVTKASRVDCGALYDELPSALRSRKSVVLALVSANGLLLSKVPSEFAADEDVVNTAVRQNGDALNSASRSVRGVKAVVLVALARDGLELRDVSFALQNDTEAVLVAVQQNGDALQYASRTLRACVTVVTTAVTTTPSAIRYATDDFLRANIPLVCTAVDACPQAFQHLPRAVRHEHSVAVAAVRRCGVQLEHCSSRLQEDREIVLAAVEQNGSAIQFAASSLRGDAEIATAAVSNDGTAWKFLPSKLQDSVDLAHIVLNTQPGLFADMPSSIRANKALAKRVCSQHGHLLQYASSELRDDPEVVLPAVSQYGLAITSCVSSRLQKDRVIAIAAVSQYGLALASLSRELKRDKAVVQAAIRQDRRALAVADRSLFSDVDILSMVNDEERFRATGNWGIPLPLSSRPALCAKDAWQQDAASNVCGLCDKHFTMLSRRRHHCRFCGCLVCGDCSFVGMASSSGERHRCCEKCFSASRLSAQRSRTRGFTLAPTFDAIISTDGAVVPIKNALKRESFHEFLKVTYQMSDALCTAMELLTAVDIVIVVDDSGSMRFSTNAAVPDANTRWAETQGLVRKLAEILFFLGRTCDVYFMNRRDALGVRTVEQLETHFHSAAPQGGTPTVSTLQRVFSQKIRQDASRPVVTYLFTDGEPDGCFATFTRFLEERPAKEHSLISIILCTDEQPIVEQYRRLENEVVLMENGIWHHLGIRGVDVTEDYYGEVRDTQRMGRKSVLTPSEYLVKCLIGPLDPAIHLMDLPPTPLFWSIPALPESTGADE